MHEESTHPKCLSRAEDPQYGIREQVGGKTLALPLPINSKTPKQDDWNRIGHVAPDLAGSNST